jgi:hypothetical protein
MCVRKLDDSQGFAIRITYRNSLRSSSMWEPRHPLLKGVNDYYTHERAHRANDRAGIVHDSIFEGQCNTSINRENECSKQDGDNSNSPIERQRRLLFSSCGQTIIKKSFEGWMGYWTLPGQ